MIEVVSLVIAVISLTGTILAGIITVWPPLYFQRRWENRRQHVELMRHVAKYRDPLFLAAQDLQSRLHNITEGNLLLWLDADKERNNNLLRYTCFLVGQFLSWTYISRCQEEYITWGSYKENSEMTRALDAINEIFAKEEVPISEMPFYIWHDQQLAIGEIMTVKEDGERFCMGYAKFDREWTNDRYFKEWFESLEKSIETMASARRSGSQVPDHRLRRLQHMLLVYIQIVDPRRVWPGTSRNRLCHAAPDCICSACRDARQNDVVHPTEQV